MYYWFLSTRQEEEEKNAAKKNCSWFLFWMGCQLKWDDVTQQQRWPVIKWKTLQL